MRIQPRPIHGMPWTACRCQCTYGFIGCYPYGHTKRATGADPGHARGWDQHRGHGHSRHPAFAGSAVHLSLLPTVRGLHEHG